MYVFKEANYNDLHLIIQFAFWQAGWDFAWLFFSNLRATI